MPPPVEVLVSAPRVLVPPPAPSRRELVFAATCLAAAGIFVVPLTALVRFAWSSTLYSHVPLVPFIAAYLAWQSLKQSPLSRCRTSRIAPFTALAAAVLIAMSWFAPSAFAAPEDRLSLTTAAFVLVILTLGSWILGDASLRRARFAVLFLAFMIPLPSAWTAAIDTILQHGSAAIAELLFRLTGTPVFYTQLTFQLPGETLRVAPECSGIHSTLALLMVSLLAGHVFLRSPSRAALLTAAVFPLALVRNGVRIFTIGALCTRYGPAMIESPIHRDGGPLFFAASLIPFFALLAWLVRRDRRAAGPVSNSNLGVRHVS